MPFGPSCTACVVSWWRWLAHIAMGQDTTVPLAPAPRQKKSIWAALQTFLKSVAALLSNAHSTHMGLFTFALSRTRNRSSKIVLLPLGSMVHSLLHTMLSYKKVTLHRIGCKILRPATSALGLAMPCISPVSRDIQLISALRGHREPTTFCLRCSLIFLHICRLRGMAGIELVFGIS